ncbi:MAG: hypothetical protein RLO52_21870 [Sandaracinaceae bacterium]|nr:hypothetical protein [Myxococcales bacterium]
MSSVYAEGGNYRIELDEGIARCVVWRRPDVDGQTGAAWAKEKISHFKALARGPARALVFDLRQAPPVTGPKTQEALGQMLESFERARRPVAVLVGDHAVQKLQLQRVVTDCCPNVGVVFTDEAAAVRHAR